VTLSWLENRLADFARDESGAAAIEYSLLAGGIVVAIIAVVYQLGSTVVTSYETVDTEMAAH